MYRYRSYQRSCLAARLIYLMRDAWYWLSCRFWHRYNTVICRSLPPTWQDRDYLLLYAAFQILEDFIEKEQPWQYKGDVYAAYAKECGKEYARIRDLEWQDIRLLYNWWKTRKDDPDYDDYEGDNCRLHQLIYIRQNLWT